MTSKPNAVRVVSQPETSRVAPPLPFKLAPIRSAEPLNLAYHELSPEPTGYSYALDCRRFEEHLQLAKLLQKHSTNGASPLNISFDDGHISNYTQALPLLEKYCLKATFFVIVGRIGEHTNFMTWGQLKELVALGHRVEAHSWSHSFLTELSDAALRQDLQRCRETLQNRVGISPIAISAPHGRWNQNVVKACSDSGFRELYTSDPWPSANLSSSTKIIGRLVMGQSMNAARLLHWVTMGPGEASLRRARHALKKSAQRMLGTRLYYSLWTRFAGWDGPDDVAAAGSN